MKRHLFITLILIFLAADLLASDGKEKEIERLQKYGIREVSLNSFYDIYSVASGDLKVRDYAFRHPVLKEEGVSERLESTFAVLKEDKIFVDGSHPFLWSYEILEGEWLTLYIHIRKEDPPYVYFIEQNLVYQDGQYQIKDMHLYRDQLEIDEFCSRIRPLPVVLQYTPVYFKSRKKEASTLAQ